MTLHRESGASGHGDVRDTSPTSMTPKPDLDKYRDALREREGEQWLKDHKGLLDDQAEYIETL